jgi:Domain of unknown function (DUF2382)
VIEVERVNIGKIVDNAPPIRHEGDTTILPVLEEVEVVVVERRIMLKEEIHVRRRRVTEMHRETILLRQQTAVVTRLAAGDTKPDQNLSGLPGDFETSTEGSLL